MHRTTPFVAIGLAAALAAGSVLAQTPISSLAPGGVTIQGTVTDVFGNRFVLQDASGRTLVHGGSERHTRLDIRPGERLTVIGRPERGGFDAITIRRENGQEIAIRRAEGPPAWAGRGDRPGPRAEGPRGPDRQAAAISPDLAIRAVEAAGYRVQGAPEAHRRHFEVVALNPRGERVNVHVDFAGRVYRETWDRGAGFGGRPEEAEARRMAEAAGFRLTGPMVAHPRHYEAEATAPDGRRVVLHIHAEGVRHADARR